ncbi:MAG TPA: hypothetical protein DCG47_10765 [Spirochaetaceae bacterium]|jgi:hypothetical protein|nr:hypothetical protein [Spirochaetaceae bacterium]
MPLKTEPKRQSEARVALVPLFILALLAPASLAAQGNALYVDVAAAGLGVANGALQLHGGLELPVGGPWSAVIEPGIYAVGTSDMLSLQLDLSGSARWRPAGLLGFFAGAGAGIAAAWASAAPWASEPGDYSLLGLKAFALAEAGWAFGSASSTIRIEPYVRCAFAIGPEILGGAAPGVRQVTEWGYALSALVGVRIVWTPRP